MIEYSIRESARLLWQLIDLGLVLNWRYKDSGIIVETDNKVAIKLPEIVDLANDWKESPYLTEEQETALQWLNKFALFMVVTMINYYMEQEYKKDTIKTEPFVKLLGDRLMIVYPDKLVVIEN